MPTQKFIDAWDNIIAKWMNIPYVSDPSNPLKPLQVHQNLSVEHLPEPYFGDPADCSIVMINLNPGEGGQIQHWSEQNNSGIVGSAKTNKYSGLVIPFSFPSSSGAFYGTATDKWWTGRRKYLEKLLGMKSVTSIKSPFAIELCGLHSKGTAGICFKKYLTALKSVDTNLDPTNVMEIAIKNSDAKFGFAVGKPIYEALKSIGYTDIQIPNPHNVKNAKGKQNARQFAVVEKNGAKVLCTWTSGGNSCPSAEFDSYIEQDIMPLL